MSGPADPLRDVAIIGGGCYGNFYAGQLETACRRHALSLRRILIVDRDPACLASRTAGRALVTADWSRFLVEFLDQPAPPAGEPDDAVVPSPLMPHLMAEWLLTVAARRWPGREIALVPPLVPLGTPYDALGPDGTRYVSFADWICPTHCVEPLVCPMIRAPRTWEMSDALADYAARLGAAAPVAGPVLFTTRHYAYGVGLFGAREIRAGRALVESADGSAGLDVVVGTISACHGAVSLLRIGPPGSGSPDLY
jgi:hypothetical protein